MEEINLDLESNSHKNISIDSNLKLSSDRNNINIVLEDIHIESNIGIDYLINTNNTDTFQKLNSLSQAKQKLESQKCIHSKITNSIKHANIVRMNARLLLEKAQNDFTEAIKNEDKLKTKQHESKAILDKIKIHVNKLIYSTKLEEIINKKKLIKETYQAQLADIISEEDNLKYVDLNSNKLDINIVSNYIDSDIEGVAHPNRNKASLNLNI